MDDECDCDDCVKARRRSVEKIPTQEQLLSPESQQLLKQGINLAKYKVAFKECMAATEIADRLTDDHTSVAIHWSLMGSLRNWLRSEFPGRRIQEWPWGNWWEVRFSVFNRETKAMETTIHRLVIR